MSIDPIMNVLCYDLRPHIDHCFEFGQKSLANVHSALMSFFEKSKYGNSNEPDGLPTPEELREIEAAKAAKEKEERLRELMEQLQEKSREAWQSRNLNSCEREWWDLTEVQKLIFYWMAVSDEIVSEEPYENFQSYYQKYFPNDWIDDKDEINIENCLRSWIKMSREQRMPFKVEACIARIASGKLDFYNERQIKNYLCSK